MRSCFYVRDSSISSEMFIRLRAKWCRRQQRLILDIPSENHHKNTFFRKLCSAHRKVRTCYRTYFLLCIPRAEARFAITMTTYSIPGYYPTTWDSILGFGLSTLFLFYLFSGFPFLMWSVSLL